MTAKNAQDCSRNRGTSDACRSSRGLQVQSPGAGVRSSCALRSARSALQAQDRQAAPEAATGWMGRTLATAKSQMVSAANPYAVEAGLEILRAGGSAADAAIAVQLVLNLVEPQSSGIGGGAFILHWDAGRKELKTYDGRETAPLAAQARPVPGRGPAARHRRGHLRRPERRRARHPARARDAAQAAGPAAVGAPVRAGHQAGRRRLPGAAAPAPAAALVRRRQLLAARRGAISSTRPAAPARPAICCRNPEFAATLRAIAERGPDAFYAGPIAEAIVRGGAHGAQSCRRHHAGRSRRLPRQGARAALRRLSRAIASAAWARRRRAASRWRRS